jgi:hypothetical protein
MGGSETERVGNRLGNIIGGIDLADEFGDSAE